MAALMAKLAPATLWRLILADIRGNRRFCLWFVVNLAIGLFGFAVIDVIKEGLSEVLVAKAREINGSDLEIAGRKALPAEGWQKLGQHLKVGGTSPKMERFTSLYSMVRHGETSLLVRVNGIGSRYPLYGSLALEGEGPVTGAALQRADNTWLTKELAERLGVAKGETIQVAGEQLVVAGIISQDSSTAMFNNRLAPEIYTARSFLTSSGLLRVGSIANYRYLFRYPQKVSANDVEGVKSRLEELLKGKGYRVKSFQDRSGSSRVLLYTADFLSLVSLMAFFLSCLGSGYLFYGYFQTKIADIGILKSLGATGGTINLLLIGSALILALTASGVALAIAALLSPFAVTKLQQLFEFGTPALTLSATAIKLIAMAIVCALMISAPILAMVRHISPAVLLDNQLASPAQGARRLRPWLLGGIGVVIMAVIYGFALWQSGSFRIGTAFFATFVSLLVTLAAIATITVAILSRWPLPRRLSLRLALSRLRSEGLAFAICVIALGLGMTIVQAIHHIKHSMTAEMAVKGERGELPSLFLFDIQDDQFAALQEHIAPLIQGQQTVISPMIRGTFRSLPSRPGAKATELSRDEQWREQTENRGVNLSYRAGLSDSEQLVAGRLPASQYRDGDVAEITIEERYASRLGVGLGDKVGFDVSGIPIDAKIVGLRKVKWNSFQPNFFVQMQPGVLEDFPKTFVAAVAARKGVGKQQLKEAVVSEFPTISIIDVDTVITRLLDMMAKLTVMLSGTAGLALMAGLVVMVSIISAKLRERQWDLNLMKILGGQRPQLYRQLLIDYGLLSVIASTTSVALGMVMAYALITVLFDASFQPDWLFAGWSSAGLVVLFVAISLAMTEQLIRRKPSIAIRE